MSRKKPREIAAQVLEQRGGPGADYVEDILEKALGRANLAPADRGLASELVYGVVRWEGTLDWLIARKTRAGQTKPMLRNLLRLGLYQIFWLDRIPNHAAVHETVETAKRCGCGAQAGFLNAVLRGYLRESAPTREQLAALKTREPHLGYSHPEWLVARWQALWGREPAARLLEWNNTPPKTCARVNTLKTNSGKLLEQWRNEKIEYAPVQRDWFAEDLVFELRSHPSLAEMPSFQQGGFYVQDPSTLLAVRELNPQPGQRVLDYCAAPGGKTTYLAQLMKNQGELLAQDITPQRLKLLADNCARLGVTCVKPVLAAAFDTRPSAFDRVLLDVPCSNSGVLRRRVDVRWRIRPEEIERLRKAQRRLLENAAPLLKAGGILVYSTCSLEPEENHELIQDFLRQHPDYTLRNERELTPFRDQVDGAFVASLERVR